LAGAAALQPRQEAPPPLRLADIFAALGDVEATTVAGHAGRLPRQLRDALVERLQFMLGSSGQGDSQLVVLGTDDTAAAALN
jgi:hypothetical protein